MTKGREHICSTCHKPAGQHGHLCLPADSHEEKCDWCGSLIPNQRHLCNPKVRAIAYICNSCGRTAVSAEHLCKPEKIK